MRPRLLEVESLGPLRPSIIPGKRWSFQVVQLRGVKDNEHYHMNFEQILDKSKQGKRYPGLVRTVCVGNQIWGYPTESNPHIISQYKEISLVKKAGEATAETEHEALSSSNGTQTGLAF